VDRVQVDRRRAGLVRRVGRVRRRAVRGVNAGVVGLVEVPLLVRHVDVRAAVVRGLVRLAVVHQVVLVRVAVVDRIARGRAPGRYAVALILAERGYGRRTVYACEALAGDAALRRVAFVRALPHHVLGDVV